jgi:hypothetical protein
VRFIFFLQFIDVSLHFICHCRKNYRISVLGIGIFKAHCY